MKTRFSIFLLIFAALSCDNSYLDLESKEELVVEGWIENGHAPIVFVSKTLPASSTPRKIDNPFDIALRYATVYIESDSARTYLTARLSDKYLLQNYFTSNALVGEVGKSYTLHVEWEDFKASATCTIPEPCPIDTAMMVGKDGSPADTAFYAQMKFYNDSTENNYYQYFVRRGEPEEIAFKAARYGNMEGSRLGTGEISVNIYNTVTDSTDMYFHKGDKLGIKLCTTEPGMADFWQRFSDAAGLSSNVVTPVSINCKGNVDGALGYWAGYGISWKELEVEQAQADK